MKTGLVFIPILLMTLIACSGETEAQVSLANETNEATPTSIPKPTSTPQIFLMPTRALSPTSVPVSTNSTVTFVPATIPAIEAPAQLNTEAQTTETPTETPEAGYVDISGPLVEIVCIFFDGIEPRSEGDEYVAIANRGDASENLEGWTLVDSADGKPAFIFPSTIIEPGAEVRVYTNEIHDDTGGFSFNSGVSIWNNSSNEPDIAELMNSNGQTVSRVSYPPGC
jgi:hypothetical protein